MASAGVEFPRRSMNSRVVAPAWARSDRTQSLIRAGDRPATDLRLAPGRRPGDAGLPAPAGPWSKKSVTGRGRRTDEVQGGGPRGADPATCARGPGRKRGSVAAVSRRCVRGGPHGHARRVCQEVAPVRGCVRVNHKRSMPMLSRQPAIRASAVGSSTASWTNRTMIAAAQAIDPRWPRTRSVARSADRAWRWLTSANTPRNVADPKARSSLIPGSMAKVAPTAVSIHMAVVGMPRTVRPRRAGAWWALLRSRTRRAVENKVALIADE